uniref:NADH-ubiquinone oxidoreductase chain 5 n=1 Tax=Helopeltis sp. TaxID=2931293 RepID=A0A8T9ZXW3_9HEMI|nr:NADH dehydrogenase subunit 5 [Helopeltis sp.]
MIYMYMVFSFFLGFMGFIFMMLGMLFMYFDYMYFMDWEIFSLNSMIFSFSIILDYMSMIFISCVMLISSMVIMYSYMYMYIDMNNYRFLLLVFSFIISMFFMIISPNMVSILLGWDGLGLVSYCLVIYFNSYNSYNSGMLTLLTNRIGDVSILLSISWMMNFGSWNYIFYLDYMQNNYILYLVILASFTKSAQIPFSSWLPAAMAAPTPVSALVHSSTLVTAGVYLLIRFWPMYSMYNMWYICMLSMLTMFMSGFNANFEFDLKKIIALSTLSQLGLMMSILFMGFPMLAFFHLISHAFFKSLLFLCAGVVIHSMNNSQDIRDMGFVIYMLPYTSMCMLVSSLSLCGFPFLSGFYSKDLIIEMMSVVNNNFMIYLLFMLSLIFTVSYTFRLFSYLFFFGNGSYVMQNFFEDNIMMYSMIFLMFMSIFMGSFFSYILIKSPMCIFMYQYMKYMPLYMFIFGLLISFFFLKISMYTTYMSVLIFYMGGMWFMPFFSTKMLILMFIKITNLYGSSMDMGWGEFFFSKSHYLFLMKTSKFNTFFENNNVKLYMIVFMMIFLIIIF